MTSLYQLKESEIIDTPVLLFDFQPRNGVMQRWSTHPVIYGASYEARVLKHDSFDMRFAADGISEAGGQVHITLANADGYFVPMQVVSTWKGGELTVRFAFFDLSTGSATSDLRVLFRGTCSGLDQATESSLRVSFHSRQAIQRSTLPAIRLQTRCPWQFPSTSDQRQLAVEGGVRSQHSPFFACGYSPDFVGGKGNSGPSGPYLTCDGTRGNCEQRGMFSTDSVGRITARFAGCDALDGQLGQNAILNSRGFVPVVYGTSWVESPVVFSRQGGGLNHYQLILAQGPIQGVLKVLANRYEIPEYHSNLRAESTGWYRVVSLGDRTGVFDGDLQDLNGSFPTGPFGSMAYLHLAIPSSMQSGKNAPQVSVLVDGLKLQRYDADGVDLGKAFTKNPSWVLLDLLQRTGWQLADIDLPSFARMATFCDTLVEAVTPAGESVNIPRYRCNLALQQQRSVSETLRGLHLATGLFIRYAQDGKLSLACEHSLAVQSPSLPAGSNSPSPIAGGWPAYEFGDGTYGLSGIARLDNGEPSIRVWSRNGADSPNRASLEFADEFNQYQADRLNLADSEDIQAVGQELSVVSKAAGIPNYSQAYRALAKHLWKSTKGNLYVEFDTSVKGIGLSPGDIITVTYLHNGFDRTLFRIIRITPGLNCALIHIVAQLHDDSWYLEDGVGLPFGSNVGMAVGSRPRPILGPVVNSDGETEFSIAEFSAPQLDGGEYTVVNVRYLRPAKSSPGLIRVPQLSSQVSAFPSGGALPAGEQLYYAVSSVDINGGESALSSLARAVLGGGENSYRTLLSGLAFPNEAVAFHVYRGKNTSQLLRIASNVPLSATFEDNGLAYLSEVPPDDQFDHARFYWRFEWLPPTVATIHTFHTIGSSALSLNQNECVGKVVRIVSGAGQGQERAILSNTSTTVTVDARFLVSPDSTSTFVISDASWHFGASTPTEVAEFEVPNRNGASIQVIGRAASSSGQESEAGLSPLGRWTLTGAAGAALDVAPPPIPYFGLSYGGRGSVDLVGIGFATLQNTFSIESGELVLHYWNELANPCPYQLSAALGMSDTTLMCTPAVPVTSGTLIQLNSEVMTVLQVLNSGQQLEVQRGAFGSVASAHSQYSTIYPLVRHTTVVPFSRGFFGSPASGTYHYSVPLPSTRIAAAEFRVTNSRGDSPTRQQSFTASVDGGLRTCSGGQYSIMVNGHLSLQSSAAPPLVIEESRSVRDVYAVIAEAPTGNPIQLMVRQNGVPYVSLTIAAGATVSNVVSGANLAPLMSAAILTLDITGVPAEALDTPGRDLTVLVRV